jgi:hypothetical protein
VEGIGNWELGNEAAPGSMLRVAGRPRLGPLVALRQLTNLLPETNRRPTILSAERSIFDGLTGRSPVIASRLPCTLLS